MNLLKNEGAMSGVYVSEYAHNTPVRASLKTPIDGRRADNRPPPVYLKKIYPAAEGP